MSDEPIETYLDELFLALRGGPRAVRRMLAEAEAHLLDATDAGVAAGLSREEAAAAAVTRFGTVAEVARRFGREAGRSHVVTVAREMALAGGWLVGVGLVAIGASGALAWLFGAAFGAHWLAGDLPGAAYTPARCAQYFALQPHATSCLAAAAQHHSQEVVQYRGAAGVLGVIVLAAQVVLSRRWGRRRLLPPAVVPAVAVTAFTLGAGFLAVQSFDGAVQGWSGVGQYLSGAVVAALVAGWYLVALVRHLGRRPADVVTAG